MERPVSPSNPDLFDVSDSLAPSRVNKLASTTTLTFDGLLKDPLRLKEDLKDGCGGQLWPAGIFLARYLLSQHSSDLSGKTIVELGAGGGLVGLAVARGCEVASPIHITDQQPMFSLMEDNIQLNQLNLAPIPDHLPSNPDVILAADCVYFEPAFPLLIMTLQSLLGPNSVCYFCFKRRRRADLRFMRMAKKAFEFEEIRDDPSATTYNRDNIFIYTIRPKRTKN
ncbi:hypothetical protein N7448_000904 [Penicillium atrosanguineum]|uniref:uncharacterized protein n=1 Tax=Penicillium atrosanguineum TaxID=1132637 RepID=UPI0023861830|nr:uncharacterized protein N7443_004300 [Penicillium atrosanguineum]KAJ5149326.1 hypothetical protein N7448_000904 [Penicillium atrosanguineum]KAJ5304640.1 hypothetical protein N7443_004300 [Penicillium atrosanguineum]